MSAPRDELESLSLDSPPTSPDSETASPLLESPPIAPAPAAATQRNANPAIAPTVSNMTPSSTPLGTLNAARGRPPPPPMASRGSTAQMNPEIMARVKALTSSRQGQPAQPGGSRIAQSPGPQVGGAANAGFPAGFRMPAQLSRPNSASPVLGAGAHQPPPARGPSLAEKRGMKLPGGLPGTPQATPSPPPAAAGGRRRPPNMTLSDMGAGQANGAQASQSQPQPQKEQSQMDKYAEYIDTKTGALKFKGKAVVHGTGIDFSSGRSFSISLDEVDTLDELGKGNYGTVYKVRHARPKFRRTGQGPSRSKARGPQQTSDADLSLSPPANNVDNTRDGTTGIVMAMKEIRLELEDSKFASIIMELDILHRCLSPNIVDFYGAFFQEGAVYICMEFMDGGSIDRIYGDGIPEGVLRKITLSTTLGLKNLKEEHNIIHRDVKPTNILVNTKGQIKICDFGVSGNLVASIAKTNIGCQSYMAPERISSGGMAQAGAAGGTYSVQSDIWSLGLTIIECAMGRYPYPPETYDNIFSQLSAIVDGEPPDLPADKFSLTARDFVAGCLNKIPKMRPTYPMLLQHAWLAPVAKPQTIMEEDEEAAEAAAENNAEIPVPNLGEQDGFMDREVGEWVIEALDRRKRGVMGKAAKPALHAAPLDAVGSPKVEKPNQGAVAVDA